MAGVEVMASTTTATDDSDSTTEADPAVSLLVDRSTVLIADLLRLDRAGTPLVRGGGEPPSTGSRPTSFESAI